MTCEHDLICLNSVDTSCASSLGDRASEMVRPYFKCIKYKKIFVQRQYPFGKYSDDLYLIDIREKIPGILR